jgi:Protein of unknown function (DUF1501)
MIASNDKFELSRRHFLRASLALATLGTGYLPSLMRSARADGFAAVSHPILANIMLNGGPDMRHPFAPPFSSVVGSYGRTYWEARAVIHSPDDLSLAALEARWNNDFHHLESNGTSFGILKQCGWLYDMFMQGKAALVCGVLSDTSRDHEQAIRNMEMGIRDANKLTFGSGWGGRLSRAANGNAVALTTSPRRFAFGPDPSAPTDLGKISHERVIPAANMRELGLPDVDDLGWFSTNEYTTRALKHYYAERRTTLPSTSVYSRFTDHEHKLRVFGELISGRLADVPIPPEIEALFGPSGVRYDLALQIRNLYDALASNDLLNLRVASMEFNGWDTHDQQKNEIEPNLEMMLGSNGALATLYSVLPLDARANLTFVIGGEFGRQLSANGGGGTDHGRGTTILMIGDAVQGGVYGTMFPEEEIPRYAEESADIEGRNAIDHVFGAVCEWVAPGSKTLVFPDHATAPQEPSAMLTGLFA